MRTSGPGGVAGVGDRLPGQGETEGEGWGPTGVIDLSGIDGHPGHGGSRAWDQLDGDDVEAAGNGGRTGEHALQGFGQATGDATWASHGKGGCATGELPVEVEEGKTPEVAAVEVANEHRRDLAGVESEGFEGTE